MSFELPTELSADLSSGTPVKALEGWPFILDGMSDVLCALDSCSGGLDKLQNGVRVFSQAM